MAGKASAAFLVLAAIVVSAALAFVLYFAATEKAEAVTYDNESSFTLSCDVDNDGDVSCTGDPNAAGKTADILQTFNVPGVVPRHSNFASVISTTAPSAWWVALDSQVPDGAWVATIYSATTLALLGGECPTAPNITVAIPLYDCSVDNSTHNLIEFVGGGENLTLDTDGDGLPQGCNQYPKFIDDQFNGVKPRARYFGWGNAVADAPPSFLNFVTFGPEQATQMSGPTADMGDPYGYVNFVFLNDPTAPATPTSISEFCSPLGTDSMLFGLSQGEGEAVAAVGPPELSTQCYGANVGVDNDADTVADDGCFVVTDPCTDSIDNDGDTTADESCDVPRGQNAKYGGLNGSHLTYGYTQSNRDVDGDTIPNNEDECPLDATANPPPDADSDTIPDVCDPTNSPGDIDEDNDNLDNQVDLCPLIDDRESTCNETEAFCQTNDCDDDGDGYVNDGCPANGAGEDNVTQCGDAIDDDGDTDVNDGCQVIGSPDNEVATDDGPNGDGIGEACELDFDGDTTNDTTTIHGAAAETNCNDNVNDDPGDDDVADDGCLLDITFTNGPYIKVMPQGAVCVGAADDDGDGYCDTTEANLGSPATNGVAQTPPLETHRDVYPVLAPDGIDDCADGADNDGDTFTDGPPTNDCSGGTCDAGCLTPENYAINMQIDPVPQTCDDTDYYEYPDSAAGVPVGIDNDGDTDVNVNDAGCTVAGNDLDADGVDDDSDNCDPRINYDRPLNVGGPDCITTPSLCYNPTQLNTNAAAETMPNLEGDACDADDDSDLLADTTEWSDGTDPKDPCSVARLPYDLDGNGLVSVLDVALYKPVLKVGACLAP